MSSFITDIKKIRYCFWIFLFFLLTEGIFRRWLLPSYSNIFLIIRDPIVVYAVFLGIKNGLIKQFIPQLMMFLGFICFITTCIWGHGNLWVALYGLRITFCYFPFIYICAQVLNSYDILRVGQIFVWMIIPMCILNIIQFYSPQNSFVNIGIGGDENGAGFSGGALGYFRPPGIFTFISALTDYYGISFGFLLYFLIKKNIAKYFKLSIPLLIACTIAYLISIPISISRTHFVQSVFIFLLFCFIAYYNPQIKAKVFWASFLFIFAISLLTLSPQIQLFIEVFFTRFNSANKVEGGIATSAFERSFGWFFRAISKDLPFWGYGDGLFSNFGMTMVYGGLGKSYYVGNIAHVFDSTEMEWGRVICENGIFIGCNILLIRFYMSYLLLKKAFRRLKEKSDYLAWSIMPYAIYCLCFLQIKAPYNLGFMTIAVICCLTVVTEKRLKRRSTVHKNKNVSPPYLATL